MTKRPLHIGDGDSSSVEFEQAEFDAFAAMSGDDNPIHVDPSYAAATRFGSTVAHGMLLFGVLCARLARWIGGPVAVVDQELTFPAPAFAGTAYGIELEMVGTGSFRQAISDGTGTPSALGEVTIGDPDPQHLRSAPLPMAAELDYRGMRLGMEARTSRAFSSADVIAFCELVDDRNPLYERGVVPVALVGGAVSRLLGVELPGPGTNWLKQHYRFHRPVVIDAVVDVTVRITRFRPDKGIVDLGVAASVGGEVAVTGRSLVLARDVAIRE